MLTTKQLNNGRFQVVAADYNRFPPAVVAAIMWRSFSTKQEAEAFIAEIK
ncbi:MAG: hypothetical protein NFW04_09515 [Candidatus Accumulibacter sp.]|nr:hypothetical protein [Accumulibacter sp.]MCM8598882.1 hypothetical protein [Accumulibacter sp.]